MSSSDLVLYESDSFCILNKPSGMSVHNEAPSLLLELKQKFPQLHFVNRLDRETSGLVVATKQAALVQSLTAALHASDLAAKIYRGIVPRPRDWEEARAQTEWKWLEAISDKAEGKKNPLGLAKDRIASETRVRQVRANRWFLDLEFQLITGRQHQIRKHCAHHAMPLVNDGRYGRDGLNQKVRETYGITRLMLHAWQLSFEFGGKVWKFEAPLPNEFSACLQAGD